MKTLTASLPKMFALYNPRHFTFDVPVTVIPWQNCGFVNEALRIPRPSVGWAMLDREVYEHNRASLVHEWVRLSDAGGPGPLIAYDPFGWDPAELRVAGWWLRMMGWMGFGHAAAHMRSRREIAKMLDGFDAWATDVYPPDGYDWDAYYEWAMLKINAHVRLCVENGVTPVVLLHLGRDVAMQVRLMAVADKRIRWALWDDPNTQADATKHAHVARDFVASFKAMEVAQ